MSMLPQWHLGYNETMAKKEVNEKKVKDGVLPCLLHGPNSRR